jgi:cbb3-type cytochrome oxidase subunit 1
VDGFIKAFIRASLLWFTLGITFGIAMAVHPAWIAFRPAHAHATVVGFLTMLVFGVGYQLLPRLFGHPLHSRRLAVAHLYCANAGLAAMVGGFVTQVYAAERGQAILVAGGVTFAAGVLMWVYNLWRTFDAADARHKPRPPGTARPLPTLGDD